MAWMVCEAVGCPHPRHLETFDVTLDDLIDWQAYFDWKFDVEHKATDGQKVEFLANVKDEYGA